MRPWEFRISSLGLTDEHRMNNPANARPMVRKRRSRRRHKHSRHRRRHSCPPQQLSFSPVPSPSPSPSAHRLPLPKASFRPGPRGYPVPVTQVLSKFSKRPLLTPGGLSCSSWPATKIHILVSPGTLCAQESIHQQPSDLASSSHAVGQNVC
jgi:hypothetical protein